MYDVYNIMLFAETALYFAAVDGNLEVLSGLDENDKIVKEGLTRLNKGMTVKPIIEQLCIIFAFWILKDQC